LLHEGSPRFDSEGRFIGYICYSTHICARKRVEVALEALAARFATLSGNAFFEAVSRHLVEALDLDLAFVGELVPNKALLKVRAGWAEGKALPAFEYALNTAPCSGFDSREMCLLADSASRLFPHDRLLSEWGAETYCAVPLLAKDGSGLGMMIAIKRERVLDCAALRVLMDVFDDRVSAELERERAEEGRRLAASVFTHANEGIVITDAHGVVLDVNAAFCRITAYAREAVIGRNLRLLSSEQHDAAFYAAMWRALRAEGQWQGEIWSRRYSGEEFAAWLTVSALRDEDGQIEQFVGLFSDITAQKAHKMQLEYIAHYDALTGLPNRVLLSDRMQRGMAQARRRGGQLALAYIDLDGFKAINDTLATRPATSCCGRRARMKAALREGDSISRLGGDEFVALLLDLPDTEACAVLVRRLLGAVSQAVSLAGQEVKVSASIGLTLYPQPEEVDADQLLRQADLAMYQAKLAGKNRYHLFDTAHDRSQRGRHQTLAAIRGALRAGEFRSCTSPR
jgi:diguanylate cyclase (GGDEF)-like protein/PAS domain S-box-containing protein